LPNPKEIAELDTFVSTYDKEIIYLKNQADFNQDNQFGKFAEKVGLLFLQDNKELFGIKDIEDVSEDKEYRKVDVDVKVTLLNDSTQFFEIKGDRLTTERMVWEVYSDRDNRTPGYTKKTICNILMYYFGYKRELYVLNMADLREWVKKYEGVTDETTWTAYGMDTTKMITKKKAPLNGNARPYNYYLIMEALMEEDFCQKYYIDDYPNINIEALEKEWKIIRTYNKDDFPIVTIEGDYKDISIKDNSNE